MIIKNKIIMFFILLILILIMLLHSVQIIQIKKSINNIVFELEYSDFIMQDNIKQVGGDK